jgi:hypothetical protein
MAPKPYSASVSTIKPKSSANQSINKPERQNSLLYVEYKVKHTRRDAQASKVEELIVQGQGPGIVCEA